MKHPAEQVPALQTSFVPQIVPFALELGPVSVQTGVPVEQLVEPRSQMLLGVQAAPVAQGSHWPVLLQTSFVPQVVPCALALGPVSMQTCVPVEQSVVPRSQTLVGVHESPAVHGTHCPVPLQTSFVPQVVPALAGVPWSAHVSTPVVHEVNPALHGALLGGHDRPAVQGPHEPPLQTLASPHDVPFGWLPAPEQTGVPVPHAMVIFSQEPASEQSVPEAQGTHDPALQTLASPHSVPLVPLTATQVECPVVQDVMPFLQVPASQGSFAVQVPASALLVWFVSKATSPAESEDAASSPCVTSGP